MNRRILILILTIILILTACGNTADTLEPMTEPRENAAYEASQYVPAPIEEPSERFTPEPEPVDHESILIGNLVHLPYLDRLDLHRTTFVAHGNQLLLVTFDYWENWLNARLFSQNFDESQILPMHDFGEERFLNVASGGDILIVITDRAVYHFDSDLNIIAEIALPQLFVTRHDDYEFLSHRPHFAVPVIINRELSQSVFERPNTGLYALPLNEDAQPRFLVEHPVPYDVASSAETHTHAVGYSALAFISEYEVLVTQVANHWTGNAAILHVDTGEIRPLTNSTAEMIFNRREALVFDQANMFRIFNDIWDEYDGLRGSNSILDADLSERWGINAELQQSWREEITSAIEDDEDIFHINFGTREITDASFLAPYLLRNVSSANHYFSPYDGFYNPRYFTRPYQDENGEWAYTFHYVDYQATTVMRLPFSINLGGRVNNEPRIVWVNPEGDVLISYSVNFATHYALARVEVGVP